MTRLIAVAGDAGGGAALTPVLRELASDPRIDLHVYAYREAAALWASAGLSVERLPERPVPAGEWVPPAGAEFVLTATSVNGVDHERSALRWAARSGVPSLSVMDFWSNYGARFRGTPDAPLELPTVIAVMDDRARAEMVREGFPADRLVVTGQPAFDALTAFRATWTSGDRDAIRHDLGASGALLVLFASQPLTDMAILTVNRESHIDERGVLRAVLASLEEMARTTDRDIVLVVRPHPREQLAASDIPAGERVRVVLSREGRPWAVALAADLVVGMTSVLMIEAEWLGCSVVSVQPGGERTDPFARDTHGALTRVYDVTQLTRALQDALASGASNAARSHPDAGPPQRATDRIVELIHSMMVDHGERND